MKVTATIGTSDAVEVEIAHDGSRYTVTIDGRVHEVDALPLEGDFYSIVGADGRSHEVSVEPGRDAYLVRHRGSERRVVLRAGGRDDIAVAAVDGPEEVLSQMPGKVVRVLVKEGQTVEEGQGLLVIEAMKMENEIPAPKAGKVTSVSVDTGQTVDAGAPLAVVE